MSSRCAWPLVLTLVAVPSAASAQSLACYTVQRGDTVTRLAKRITGSAANKYQPWFDIEDPWGRSVPKSQYDRIRSGWRACVLEKTAAARPLNARQVLADEAAKPVEPAVSPAFRSSVVALRAGPNVDPANLWIGVAVVVPALGFLVLGGYVRRRSDARIFMSQFAHLFVREFERPLVQDGAEPAIRARLRVRPYRSRLEICLAPGKGRRYPNLSDHRKNVEYDVTRVLSALADDSFVCGRLRMREEWVVVPFRFSARQKQRGVRCISSL